jgi:hypothetical protein
VARIFGVLIVLIVLSARQIAAFYGPGSVSGPVGEPSADRMAGTAEQ